jgi:hypothetical protein
VYGWMKQRSVSHSGSTLVGVVTIGMYTPHVMKHTGLLNVPCKRMESSVYRSYRQWRSGVG